MSILNRILNESKIKGIETPGEGAELYDEGIQNRTSSPDINISQIPQQTPVIPIRQGEQEDSPSFVDESVFGIPERLEDDTEFTPGYSEQEAFVRAFEQRTSALDWMELPDDASDMAKTAAYNSSFNVKDYTVLGEGLRSFAAGLGQVVSGVADTVDWLQDLQHKAVPIMPKGGLLTPILGFDASMKMTSVLRDIGEEMETWDDKIDMSSIEGQFISEDEEGNIDVSYEQMLNPKFWYTKVAQQIPNLLMFMIPAAKGAKWAQAASKGTAFGRTTLFSMPSVRGLIQNFGNKGVGKASKMVVKGEDVAQFFGGAAGGNFAEGAMLAAESHRSVLEDGGTRDQAAMAGWGVMKDNALWIVADGFQYAVLTRGLGAIGGALKLRSGVNFKTGLTDFMIGSGLAVSEGKLEEFQEVYQDWRVKKRAAQVKGETWDMSYWDYYHSPEVAETRVVAFALGFASAGVGTVAAGMKDTLEVGKDSRLAKVFNESRAGKLIKKTVNGIAERNNLLDNKIESTGFSRETDSNLVFARAAKRVKDNGFSKEEYTAEEKAVIEREQYKEEQLLNIIGNGELDHAKSKIQELVEKGEEAGGINEKDGKAYLELLDKMNNAFSPYNNSNLQRLVQPARKELARLAYYIQEVKNDMKSSDAFYDAEIERIKESENHSEEFINEQVAKIEQERESANQEYQDDINNYTSSIEALFKQSEDIVNSELAELERKNIERSIIKKEAEEREAPTRITEEEVSIKGVSAKSKYKVKQNQEGGFNIFGANNKLIETVDSEIEARDKIKELEKVDKEKKQERISKLKERERLLKEQQQKQGEDAVSNAEIDAVTARIYNLERGISMSAAIRLVENKRKRIEKAKEKNRAKKDDKGQQSLRLGMIGKLEGLDPYLGSRGYQNPRKKDKDEEPILRNHAQRYIGFERVFRDRLRKKGVNLVVTDYLMSNPNGRRYYGAAQGLTIFLDAGKATQETFFHELAHVYLAESWYVMNKDGTYKMKNGKRVVNPIIKDAIALVIKNPIYKHKEQVYRASLLFENHNGGITNLENLIKEGLVEGFESWKENDKIKVNQVGGKTLDNYLKYVKRSMKIEEERMKVLKKSEQRIILEECLAGTMGKIMSQPEIDENFNKEDQEKREAILKRFWGSLKNRFTKEEAAEILENTGNESLSDLDNAINNITKDFLNKEGRYEFRRDREGFSNKLANQSELEVNIIRDELSQATEQTIEDLKDNDLKEELEMPLHKKGTKLTASGKQVLKKFILENEQTLIDNIREEFGRDSIQFKYFTNKRNRAAILSKILNDSRISENVNEALESDENSFLEGILGKTRNGENKELRDSFNEYLFDEVEISGERVTRGNLKSNLYQSIWGTKDPKEFEAHINRIMEAISKGTPLSRKEEILGRYFIFMKERYNRKGYAGNPILEIHHDISGYKRINFHQIQFHNDGRITFSKSRGADANVVERFLRKNAEKNLTVPNPQNSTNFTHQEIAKIKYLSSIANIAFKYTRSGRKITPEIRADIVNFLKINFLQNYPGFDLDNAIDDKFINNFFKEDPKTGKSVFGELMDDALQIQVLNPKRNDAGMATLDKGRTWVFNLEKANSAIDNAFSKFRQSDKVKDALKNNLLTNDDVNNIKAIMRLSAKRKQKDIKTYPRASMTSDGSLELHNTERVRHQLYPGFFGTIFKYLSNEMGLGDFPSQIQQVTSGSANFISKKHQADILIESLENMSSFEIKDLFGDNLIIQEYLKDRQKNKPEIVQLLGSIIKGEGKDSGKATANEMTMMQVGLIANAIQEQRKKKGENITYAQNISIVSDKDMQVYLKNAKYYKLKEAREIFKKLKKQEVGFKEGASKYISDINIKQEVKKLEKFIKEQESLQTEEVKKILKDPRKFELLEAIVLNNVINKHQAKDLIIGPAKYFKDPSDYIKRTAGAFAMHIPLGARIEPIMLQDVEIDGINKTDAAAFIRPEDAKEYVEKGYGAIRKVGKHYKFVYYGQNLDNNTFSKKVGARHPMYIKTNVFVLTDSFIKKNPKLGTLRKALDARSRVGVMPIATFSSALKVQGKQFKKSLININNLKEDSNGKVYLKGKQKDFNKHQDSLWKDEDTYGLSGDFFGMQTELDKTSNTVSIGKQIMSNLLSNPATFEEGISLQQEWGDLFEQMSKKELQKFVLPSGKIDAKRIEKFVKDITGEVDVDVYGASFTDLLKSESFDNGSIEVIKKKIASLINKKVIKNRSPRNTGYLGYQASDFAFGLGKNEVKTDKGLKSYFDSKGKPRVDKNGNLLKAEIIVDSKAKFLKRDKNGKVILGQTVIFQRIPNSKMGDAIVGVVKGVETDMGSMMQIPSDLSHMIGSDLDGDALHVMSQKFDKDGNLDNSDNYNKVFNKTAKFLLKKENIDTVKEGIDFESAADKAERELKKYGLSPVDNNRNDLSLLGDNEMYRSNIGGTPNIGAAASNNSLHKLLSPFEIIGKTIGVNISGIKINKNYKEGSGKGKIYSKGKSWLDLAYILNIHLDEANKGRAAKLNMNSITLPIYMELVQRGVKFETAMVIVNSPVVKALVNRIQNNPKLKTKAVLNEMLFEKMKQQKEFTYNNIAPYKNYKDMITREYTKGSKASNEHWKNRNKVRNILKAGMKTWYGENIIELPELDLDIKENMNWKSAKTSYATISLVHQLISGQQELSTISKLMGLENRMPENAVEAKTLREDIRSLINSSHQVSKGIELEGVNLEGFIQRNKKGEFVKFTSPILQKNYMALRNLVWAYQNSDPAYTGGYKHVLNDIFKVKYQKDAFISEVERAERNKEISNVENLIRTFRLGQEKGVYNFDISKIVSKLIPLNVTTETQAESLKEIIDNLTPNTPLKNSLNTLVPIILNMAKGNPDFDFINKYLQLEQTDANDLSNPHEFGRLTHKAGTSPHQLKIKKNKSGETIVQLSNIEISKEGRNSLKPIKDLKNINPATIKKDFKKLPKSAQEFLLLYDLIINNHTGPNSLLPYIDNSKIKKHSKKHVQASDVNKKGENIHLDRSYEADLKRYIYSNMIKAPYAEMTSDFEINNKNEIIRYDEETLHLIQNGELVSGDIIVIPLNLPNGDVVYAQYKTSIQPSTKEYTSTFYDWQEGKTYTQQIEVGSNVLVLTPAETFFGNSLVPQKSPNPEYDSNIESVDTVIKPIEKKKIIKPGIQKRMTEQIGDVIKPSAKKHLPKEKVKTKIATQYIGEGAPDSSTDRYKKMYETENAANTGAYTADDTVYVSSNGKRANRVNPVVNGKLQGVYKNIDLAIAAGSKIVMDTKAHIEKTAGYNIGEVALAEYLSKNGYERVGNSGVWQSKTVKETGQQKLFMMEEEGQAYEKKTEVVYKTIANHNGKKIVSHDGKFGREIMYQTEEESERLEREPRLTFEEYINQRKAGSNIRLENINEEELAILNQEYDAYKRDLETVENLENKYLKKTVANKMVIETNEYSIKDLLSIVNDLKLLDPVARKKLYDAVTRTICVKLALQTINNQISNAKKNGLGEKIINDLKEARRMYEEGDVRSDIRYGDLWLSPDISSSERAEIAALLNELNESQMEYQKDMEKLRHKMDKPFKALLKERLKQKTGPWFIHWTVFKFVPFAKYFYNKFLFQNIIEEVEYMTEDGQYTRRLQLKDFTNLDGTFNEEFKNLSKAEQDYYKMYTETTQMIEKHLNQKIGEDGRVVLDPKQSKGPLYVPHLTSGRLEMMIARNMTAGYITANYSYKLRDISVKGINPMTGKEEIKPLSMFINDFMENQIGEGTSMSDVQRSRRIKALIKQANEYVTKGVDAAGNPALVPEDVESIGSADTFNRYLHKRSLRAEMGASVDIHASLTSYVRKQVFSYGLDSQSGYSSKGLFEKIPLIDGVISYASYKDNPYVKRWVKELLLDRYIHKKSRKSIFGKDGKRHWSDNVFDALHKWTMFIGLGLNFSAAVGNIAIGKYNAFRQMGWTNFALGEKRVFGFGVKGFNKKNADKTRAITKYFGLIADAGHVTEDMFSGGFGELMFIGMIGSEKYIQRAQFAGQISEAEWNSFEVVDGEVKVIDEVAFKSLTENADEYKSKVYEVQGKGYTDLDQRLIQSYSMLFGLLQFKRWLPTFIMDRFSEEKILRSGKGYIGSMRATFDYFGDVFFDKDGHDVRGKWGEAFRRLPKHRQEAIQRAYRGTAGMVVVLGLMVMAGAFSDDDEESATVGYLNKLFWDMNLIVNIDKWKYMVSVPSLQTGENILWGFKELLSGDVYQRDTKYGEKGQSKARGRLARLFPTMLRERFARE